jgi:hypothetical protein
MNAPILDRVDNRALQVRRVPAGKVAAAVRLVKEVSPGLEDSEALASVGEGAASVALAGLVQGVEDLAEFPAQRGVDLVALAELAVDRVFLARGVKVVGVSLGGAKRLAAIGIWSLVICPEFAIFPY